MEAALGHSSRVRRPSPLRVSLGFVGVALLCLLVADLEITTLNPWQELGRLFAALLTPDFTATERLFDALASTLAFALLGLSAATVLGFGLAVVFDRSRTVRVGCAVVRSVHELFWALIFLQMFGLSVWTGLLAIALPYAGILAKVYAEILEEADPTPRQSLPQGVGRVSAFFFARLPDVWPHIKSYTLYRLECALRSSAVLGFVGLPTLGFHLETAFTQGQYAEVWALLIIFYVLIASMRLWMRGKLLPLYLVLAAWAIPIGADVRFDNIVRFLTQDIVPHPIRAGDGWAEAWAWGQQLLVEQVAPGVFNTLVLTQIALVATGALTLVLFPLVSPLFLGRGGRTAGHVALVVMRSTPEYILAFILLQLWGPSMLPAVVALALHNGAIIGHLVGRQTETMTHRPDAPPGRIDRYAYEVLPRVYGNFLAFLFYRWEVILRETAILGILGIHTLGFFVDSAFADLRLDKALILIAVTAALNLGVDAASRRIRAHLRLTTTPDAA